MEIKNSILQSVKKLLGIEPEDEEFDVDIILNINAVLASLTQMGVGPNSGFTVMSAEDTYEDFLGEDIRSINMVKIYIPYKVRLSFDPPTSSIVAECLKEAIKELEWRLFIQNDPRDTFLDE